MSYFKNKMSSNFFIQGFLNFRQTGTVFPCSRYVGRTVAVNLRSLKGPRVELGSGPGTLTPHILGNMGDDDYLSCFEINPAFFGVLERMSDMEPRMDVYPDSAENFAKYLNGDRPSAIVSSLPLQMMNSKQVQSILGTVKDTLQDGGRFIQVQYSPRNERLYRKYFDIVKRHTVVRNLPPCTSVYVCSNLQQQSL